MLLRHVGIALAVVAGAYVTLAGGFYAAMRQSPERFGAIMAKLPMPVLMIFPFRPMWMSARAGALLPGDPAPDFQLPTVDHSRTVTLSEEWRDRPVVLIFGSYT